MIFFIFAYNKIGRTTITIKNGENLPRTEFDTVQDFIDFALNYLQRESSLTKAEIAEAKAARDLWKKDKSSFRRVVTGQ